MVKRRHTHVGAPDNRINGSLKSMSWRPGAKDMNPELGLGGHRLTEKNAIISLGLRQEDVFLYCVKIVDLKLGWLWWLAGDLRIKKPVWGRWLKWVIKNLWSPIASQFIVSVFDNAGLVWIDKDFMECEVCGMSCKRRAQVFIQGDELQMCRACVVRLRTQRLKYCEKQQRYRFNGYVRKIGLLRGRIPRDF